MAQFRIPLEPDNKNYRFFITLDDVEYYIDLKWNIMVNAWYMGMGLATGEAIFHSMLVESEWPLFANEQSPLLPPGNIIVFDTENLGRRPYLGELGRSFEMIYFDEDELT